MNKTLVIGVIDNQGDRILLYAKPGTNNGYHVITNIKEEKNLKVGDTIEYEPFGVNFGWFVKKL